MKKLLLPAIALIALWLWQRSGQPPDPADAGAGPPASATAEAGPADTFEDWRGGNQVAGSGTVVRILDDDRDGSRHQRFIVELDSGRTLLIAHNIDLAPRIDSLREGDTVEFHGEYEWNERGGVIHWTHHDPQGEHQAGWLRHNGRVYQ